MKRKFLSGLLALSMVLTLLPGTALADGETLTISAETGSGLTKEEDGSYTIPVSDSDQTVTLTLTKANVTVEETTKAVVTVAVGNEAGKELDADNVAAFGTGDTATATITVPADTVADTTYSVTAKVTPKAAEGNTDTPTPVSTTEAFTFTVVEAAPTTYTVSGTVAAGTTEVEDLTGIDVKLYASKAGEADGTAVDTATTEQGGAFSFSEVEAGTYVAVVAAVAGSYAESKSDEFTVEADNVTDVAITLVAETTAEKITLEAKDFTVAENVVYDGEDHKATAVTIKDAANKAAKVTYAFKVDGAGVTDVKNAGTYAVTAAVEGDENFEGVSEIALGNFEIAQKELTFAAKNQAIAINGTVPDLTTPALNTHYTIDGLIAADEANAASIVTAVAMKYTDSNDADATPDATTEGTYKIVITSATVAPTSNYKAAVANPYTSGTLTISQDGKVPATAITLDKETLELEVDATGKLTATLTPLASTDEVVFESNNETVATVAEDGTVTAVAAGTATITASIKDATADQADVKDTCEVTVTAAEAEKVTLEFAPDGGELAADAEKITITASDEDATIHYTVDGTAPTVTAGGSVKAYDKTNGIAVADLFTGSATSVTIKAVAVKVGALAGDIVTKTFTKAAAVENKAEIANVTIAGEAGKALEGDPTIVITLTGEAIDATAAAEKTNYTLVGAPTGVDFTVAYDSATKKATLSVTGRPEAECEAAISVKIGKAVFGADADVTTVANPDAKWVITRAAIDVDAVAPAKPNVSVDPTVESDQDKKAVSDVVSAAIEASGETLDLEIDRPATTPVDDATQDAINAAKPDSSELDTLKATITEKNITALTSVDANDLKTVVQTYMDIAIKDVTIDTDAVKSIEFDVTPMYRVVVTKQDVVDAPASLVVFDEEAANADTANAVFVDEGEVAIKAGETVTVKIPLGDNALGNKSTLYVTHVKDGGTKYYYTGTVDGSKVLSFDNPHGFSTMIVSDTESVDIVAKLTHNAKETGYDTLTGIGSLIANGDTLALTKALDADVTIALPAAAMTFTITVQGADEEAYAAQEAFISIPDPVGYEVTTSRAGGSITVTVAEKPAPNVWTVTFDSQGGSAVAPGSVAKDGDGKATKPADPTRSGYTFGGWYKEADCTTAWDFDNDVVDADITLYAKWTQNSGGNKRPSSSGGGGGATTSTTVAISGDGSSIKADVKISGGTATIGKVDDVKKVIGEDVVTIDASGLKKDIDTVKVDSSIVNAIANNEDSEGLEIKLSDGTVTFDADAVASLKGGDMTVKLDKTNANSLNSKQKDAVKDMDAQAYYELTINKALKDGQAEVRIPFAVPNGKDASDMALVRVSESGEAEEVSARFSGSEVRFTATESGDYVIVAKAAQAAEPEQPTTPAQPTADFRDVDASAWYGNAVNFVVANGLMSGVGDGQFAPNTNLSRAMLAQILYNQAGRPAAGDAAFNDVASGMWYTNAIAWAAAQGVVSGYGNGMFGPNDNITREQLAVMLYRYAGSPAADGSLDSFADAGKVSGYAQNALVWATTNGVMSGKGAGNLDPAGLATRAEVAQMLYNYLNR